ncbi:MAG TPA: outer membrane beta-barrel protein [Terriglobales bacterium]|nr:outer membrane beta-barrel protein [Terriglobales bacterium]
MFKTAAVVVAGLCLLAAPALAQDGGWEFGVSAGAVFTHAVEGNGIRQSATNSGMYLLSMRRRLGSGFGVDFNYGRTKNSQEYENPSAAYRIQDQITEVTGNVVFSPFSTARLETFILGGGGVLFFSPNSVQINQNLVSIQTARQGRGVILYGAGVDYHLISRFSLRLQYRGLFYSPPDFKVQVTPLFTGARGHMAEPSVGIVFRF